MQKLGASLKRKSFGKIDPELPHKQLRQPSSNGRTKYKELDSPEQELKRFKRKQFLTLSTERSVTKMKSQAQQYQREDADEIEENGYDEDHHNTASLAQLLDKKEVHNPENEQHSSKKQSGDATVSENVRSSLEIDDQAEKAEKAQQNEDKVEQEEQGEQPKEGGQNFDDYVLGEKAQEADKEANAKRMEVKAKKYQNDFLPGAMIYKPTTESQLRMEQRYWESQRKKMQIIHEDEEIIAMMRAYKVNKKQIDKQSMRKFEISKMTTKKPHLQKVTSLPSLKKVKQYIELPQVQENVEKFRAPSNFLATNIQKSTDYNKNLMHSLSYARLGFGTKAPRQICSTDLFEREMEEMNIIQQKFRSKGIPFNRDQFRKGILNVRNVADYNLKDENPDKDLPSNFYLKKYPL